VAKETASFGRATAALIFIPMDKEYIMKEIRRTAKVNEGLPLGWRQFEAETGIRYSDWYGKYWTRWSDAVREAGLKPYRLVLRPPTFLMIVLAITGSVSVVPCIAFLVNPHSDLHFVPVAVLTGSVSGLAGIMTVLSAARSLAEWSFLLVFGLILLLSVWAFFGIVGMGVIG
jgi:hypothetical protein